jgi:DNA invertase Pin-like site-specific DNA recombinase
MKLLGYARVSTTGQVLDIQLDHLRTAGCVQIFMEKASGAKSNRPQMKRMLRSLAPGDTLIVTRLDRLARSTFDLLGIMAQIAKRGALFRSLAEPWADTSTPTGRLMLTLLGGIAEFERHLIRERTAEGRERARKAGVRFGAKPKLDAMQRDEVKQRRLAGESTRSLAREYAVSPNTISRVR